MDELLRANKIDFLYHEDEKFYLLFNVGGKTVHSLNQLEDKMLKQARALGYWPRTYTTVLENDETESWVFFYPRNT